MDEKENLKLYLQAYFFSTDGSNDPTSTGVFVTCVKDESSFPSSGFRSSGYIEYEADYDIEYVIHHNTHIGTYRAELLASLFAGRAKPCRETH